MSPLPSGIEPNEFVLGESQVTLQSSSNFTSRASAGVGVGAAWLTAVSVSNIPVIICLFIILSLNGFGERGLAPPGSSALNKAYSSTMIVSTSSQ